MLTTTELEHCTLQLWLPDEDSEQHLYRNDETHGRALCDLVVTAESRPVTDDQRGAKGS
jgi:hypothetical protein